MGVGGKSCHHPFHHHACTFMTVAFLLSFCESKDLYLSHLFHHYVHILLVIRGSCQEISYFNNYLIQHALCCVGTVEAMLIGNALKWQLFWGGFSLVWFSLGFDVGLVQNHKRWSTLIQRILFRLSSQVNVDTVQIPFSHHVDQRWWSWTTPSRTRG